MHKPSFARLILRSPAIVALFLLDSRKGGRPRHAPQSGYFLLLLPCTVAREKLPLARRPSLASTRRSWRRPTRRLPPDSPARDNLGGKIAAALDADPTELFRFRGYAVNDLAHRLARLTATAQHLLRR